MAEPVRSVLTAERRALDPSHPPLGPLTRPSPDQRVAGGGRLHVHRAPRGRSPLGFATAMGLACTLPSLAEAHGIDHPRKLTLDLSSTPTRVALTLTLSRPESTQTRRLFDRDRDGRLGDAERGPLMRYLEAKAWGGLRFTCDGRDLAPARARTSFVGLDDTRELQVQLGTTVALSGTCHLEDGGDMAGHLPVTLLGPGAALEAPRAGEDWNLPARRATRLSWKR